MSDFLQTGQHPDADQLSAFIEHVLPAHEHESMLAHLAVCPDCRRVVAVSMPPMEELPEAQPARARKPWLSGWNLLWPVAAAFATLILVTVLVNRGGRNASPAQIAETHLPGKPAVAGGAAPAHAGLPAARGSSASPATQGGLTGAVRAAKATGKNAAVEPKVEDKSQAYLPLEGRNIESLQPLPGPASPRVMSGTAMSHGSGSGSARQTQASGVGLNVQQPPPASASLPAAAPITAYAMNGTAVAPPAASPAPPLPSPPAATARAANGSAAAAGASTGGPVNGVALDALSDDTSAVEAETNASSTVLSGASLAGLVSRRAALRPLPSGLPLLSVATAGQTILALDSGNALFLSGDGGTHWRAVRAKWQGRAVSVALAIAPVALAQQAAAMNQPAIRGELQGRIGTAVANAPIAQPMAGGDATLAGQVTDPAGAVVPGASVTATNVSTAAEVMVKTDAAGSYFAGGLAPGTYRIDATARGFARQELKVTLAASQQERADLKLEVGQMTETVTVTNAPPQIETQDTSPSAEFGKSKSRRSAPPLFAITTDAGVRWLSADGQSWKRE